jgi:anti-anti-sigma factor
MTIPSCPHPRSPLSIPGRSVRPLPASEIVLGKCYNLGLVLGRDGAHVTVTGQVDISAAADLTRLLSSLDILDTDIHLDLSGVTFLDTHGVAPLIESCRRRIALGLAPLLLAGTSRAVRRVLDMVGIGGNGTFNVAAWDRLDKPAQNPLLPGGQQRLQAPGPPPPRRRPGAP